VAQSYTVAAYDDLKALKAFAVSVDAITYEFENIPAAPLKALGKKLRPGPDILTVCQHRLLEKQALNKLAVATAPFAPVGSDKELQAALKKTGLPAVLKTARMGYDGKGQWKLRNTGEAGKIWQMLAGEPGRKNKRFPDSPIPRHPELILEGFIPFAMEISVIVARGADGKMACYCPVENIHKNHILSETIAPARISPQLAKKAEGIARKIAEGLGLTGLMAVEMFVTKDNKILVNELAPRPHNSGHWTLDACVTSQFEQTIRAVAGLPLGSAKRLYDARMLNLIGDEVKQWKKHIASPCAKLHLYGKKESRPGRKMGHVTMLRHCEEP